MNKKLRNRLNGGLLFAWFFHSSELGGDLIIVVGGVHFHKEQDNFGTIAHNSN